MNERTGDLTFDLSHEGELRVGARLRSAVDLDRFIDSLYHVAFLLWPKEITELAAGEDAGDRPAMMRAGAGIAAEPPKTAADNPPAVRHVVEPRPAPESERPATGRGSQAGRAGNPRAGESVVIGRITYPTKRAAIVALFKGGMERDAIVERVGTTPEGYKAAMKKARELGELPR